MTPPPHEPSASAGRASGVVSAQSGPGSWWHSGSQNPGEHSTADGGLGEAYEFSMKHKSFVHVVNRLFIHGGLHYASALRPPLKRICEVQAEVCVNVDQSPAHDNSPAPQLGRQWGQGGGGR